MYCLQCTLDCYFHFSKEVPIHIYFDFLSEVCTFRLFMLLTNYLFLAPIHITNLVIGQNLGQDLCFREQFDVAVARAVAEMRILGNLEKSFSWFLLCIFKTSRGSTLLIKLFWFLHFQLSTVFLWFVLVVCL